MEWLNKIDNIQNIYVKEIKETLRDKRTLFIMTLLPILLYPLLMLGITQLIVYQMDKIGQENITIAVEGYSDKINALLLKEDFNIVTSEDAWSEVAQGKAILGLRIPLDFDQSIVSLQDIPRVLIYYSGANEKARLLLNRLQTVLKVFQIQSRRKLLEGSPVGLEGPFSISLKNTAGAKKQGAFEFGRLLALLVVLMAITFPLYPAIDMAAGEKERGTMETLLVSPATRFEIVMGKYLAIFSIAMFGSILNLASMGVTFGYFTQQSNLLIKSSQQTQSQDVDTFKANELLNLGNEPIIHDGNGQISHAYFHNDELIATINKSTQQLSFWHLRAEKKIYQETIPNINGILPNNKGGWFLHTTDGAISEMIFVSGEPKRNKIWQSMYPIEKLLLNKNNKKIAFQQLVEGKNSEVVILDIATLKEYEFTALGFSLVDFSENSLLLSSNDSLVLLDVEKQEQRTLPGYIGKFYNDYTLLIDNQNILLLDSQTDNIITQSPLKSYIDSKVTCIDIVENRIVLGTELGLVEIWTIKNEKKQWQLQFQEYLGIHESSIKQLHTTGHEYLSLDSTGNVKFWSTAPPLKFSISSAILIKMFVLLIPLIALFSALCLGLSIFARSYKEGQHYLTPMVIVVMPLVMVALLPNMNLSTRLCFIPVANIVLLYKEMFLGSATYTQTFLVFFSTIFYAFLTIRWAIHLFGREDVLFREVDTIKWKFWRKDNNSPNMFTPSQCTVIFLSILILFHFSGPQLAPNNILLGQALSMILFLAVVPFLLIIGFRYQPKEIFSVQDTFPIKKILFIIGIGISSLIISAALAAIQNQIVSIDTKNLYKGIVDIVKDKPLWLLVVIFAVLPGICEELFFRGFILSCFRNKMNDKQAIVWTAFLFALMHMDITRLTFTFVMGIVLGILLVRTQNILVPIFVHIMCNSLSIAFSYLIETKSMGKLHEWASTFYAYITQNPNVAIFCSLVVFSIILKECLRLLPTTQTKTS